MKILAAWLVLIVLSFAGGAATANAQTTATSPAATPTTTGAAAPTASSSSNPSASPPLDQSITATSVFGEVTVIDRAAKQLMVKTNAGNMLAVLLDTETTYKRVPPGETTLSKAVDSTLAEVAVGDQVFARGRVAEDRKSIPAKQLILMTKGDITQKQERERAEWNKRGIVGVVTKVDPATKEITLRTTTAAATTPAAATQVVVATTEGSRFRRYQTDSVKFGDAKPSTFSELKLGDQVRALVNKNADSSARSTAEEIVSGSFRTIGGAVTAVNPETGEIKINDVQSKQPLTVAITKDSLLRRLPPDQAKLLLLQSTQSARPAGNSGGGGGDAKASSLPTQQAAAASGSVDLQNMLEQLPALTIAEMKPGDMIVLSSASEPGATRVTAIALVAGLDALLKAMQGAQTNRRGAGPSGAINLGIGSP